MATKKTQTTIEGQTFKVEMRNQKTFRHHAFKLKCEKMTKNTSYKKYSPILEQFEHSHIFHTVDSQGRTQTKSQPVGGHYHYIEFAENADGTVTAKCGPAKHIVDHKLRSGGFRKKEDDITFYDEKADRTITDNHTHDLEHLYSSELQVDASRAQATAAITQSLEPKKVEGFKELNN